MNAFEMWTLALEERGENTLIRAARRGRAPGSPLETFFFPHAHFDGVGLIAMLLRSYEGGFAGPIRTLRNTTRPSLVRRLQVMWRDINSPHAWVVPWKHFDREKQSGIPKAIAHLVLDEEETARLNTRVDGANTNSRLLWALDRAIATDVAEPLPEHLWMIPVNMRGPIRLASEYGSHAAQVPITLAAEATPSDVQASVRKALTEDMHWGAWDSFTLLPRLAGQEGVHKFVNKYYSRPGHAWFGTFSNMGAWMPASSEPAQYDWFIAPPVTLAQPIGAAAVQWAGRLTLSIQAHAALTQDPRDVERWLKLWKELALDAAGRALERHHVDATKQAAPG